jgi:hypothetical protein
VRIFEVHTVALNYTPTRDFRTKRKVKYFWNLEGGSVMEWVFLRCYGSPLLEERLPVDIDGQRRIRGSLNSGYEDL